MRKTFRIDRNIDPEVKVGDRIKLTSDETLTHLAYQDMQFDLLRKYPMLGLHEALEDIEGVVTHTGITDFAVMRDDKYVTYTQDIIVSIGSHMFRTSSRAVRVLKNSIELIDDMTEMLANVNTRSKKRQAEINHTMGALQSLRDKIQNHR